MITNTKQTHHHTTQTHTLPSPLSKHQDKLLHFIVCGWVFLIPTIFLNYPWPGITAALTWALRKEFLNSKFDWLDILADISGITFAYLIWAL